MSSSVASANSECPSHNWSEDWGNLLDYVQSAAHDNAVQFVPVGVGGGAMRGGARAWVVGGPVSGLLGVLVRPILSHTTLNPNPSHCFKRKKEIILDYFFCFFDETSSGGPTPKGFTQAPSGLDSTRTDPGSDLLSCRVPDQWTDQRSGLGSLPT